VRLQEVRPPLACCLGEDPVHDQERDDHDHGDEPCGQLFLVLDHGHDLGLVDDGLGALGGRLVDDRLGRRLDLVGHLRGRDGLLLDLLGLGHDGVGRGRGASGGRGCGGAGGGGLGSLGRVRDHDVGDGVARVVGRGLGRGTQQGVGTGGGRFDRVETFVEQFRSVRHVGDLGPLLGGAALQDVAPDDHDGQGGQHPEHGACEDLFVQHGQNLQQLTVWDVDTFRFPLIAFNKARKRNPQSKRL